MAATSRLSPAANLLRNSKLFALPSAIPLPPSLATAEPTASSDTATTIYPTRAAIATPRVSLLRGDWGLKRALPLKSTTKTSSPTVRLTKDIDSEGHVADFESAADHVQTHAKWQDIYFQMKNKPEWTTMGGKYDPRELSVFHPELDNATVERQLSNSSTTDTDWNVPAHLRQSMQQLRSDREATAQRSGQSLPPPPRAPAVRPLATKRWRYQGPWLAGMTELEFEAYLNHMGKEKIAAFEQHLKDKIVADKERRRADQLVTDKAEDIASTEPSPPIDVTNEDLAQQLRMLRQNPDSFGPEIAEFLDLPDGHQGGIILPKQGQEKPPWTYRSAPSVASSTYQVVGPPRTHPSAGFSYVRSTRHTKNTPQYGPQLPEYFLPARHLKDQTRSDVTKDEKQAKQVLGVGGFVSRLPKNFSGSGFGPGGEWVPKKGGPKIVAHLQEITVAQDGSIELLAQPRPDWGLQRSGNNVPLSTQELRSQEFQNNINSAPAAPERLEPLDDIPPRSSRYERRDDTRDPSVPNQAAADVIRELDESFGRPARR